jgi:hypothetical protein
MLSTSATPEDQRTTASNNVRDADPSGSQRPGVEEKDDPSYARPTPSKEERDASGAGSQRRAVDDPTTSFRATESQDYRDASALGSRRLSVEDMTPSARARPTAPSSVRDASSSDGRRPGVEGSARHSLIPHSSSRKTPASKTLIGFNELSTIVQTNFQRAQIKGKGRPRESLDLEGSNATPVSTQSSLPHTDEEIYANARAKMRTRTISNASSGDRDTYGGASTLTAWR